MTSMISAFALPMVRQAFIAVVLGSATFSLAGILALTLNLANIRFTLMHIGFLGAAISLAIGLDPLAGTLLAIFLGTALLGPAAKVLNSDTSAAGGLFMVASMALAFIIFHKCGVPAMEAFSVLGGNALLLSARDVAVVALIGILISLAVYVLRWPLQVFLSGPDTARALGVRTGWLRLMMLMIIGVSIGTAMKLVGAILVDSMVLLPALAAMSFGQSFRATLKITPLIGAFCGVIGFLAAVALDLPVGSSVAVSSVVVLAACLGLKRLRPFRNPRASMNE